jgi:predicted DNA binding CopG/RHH family protein
MDNKAKSGKAPGASPARTARGGVVPVAGTGKAPGGSVPLFASEAAERKYWETHDSTGHVDWRKAQRVMLPNLKPTSKSISLRLPIGLLEALRVEANRRDVPYQSLIKVWLSEKVAEKSPA